MSFGQNLKNLRDKKGISQNKLSTIIEISRQAIAAYEGDKREPNFEILIKIADYFNVSIDHLLGRCKAENSCNEEILKWNIKYIMNDMSMSEFISEIGNKTGILLPVDKIEAIINGNLTPDNITLKILAMYSGVSVDFLCKTKMPRKKS